jgi:molybdopterin molybdotransferase
LRRLHRVSEALPRALQHLRPPPELEVPLASALGMYAAERVVSSFKLPPAPKSVVDGYAVRAADVEAASQHSPVPLRLRGELLRPGSQGGLSLGPGEAVKVETGALLPEGADAVVPVEDAVEEGGRVLVLRKVARLENVSLPGEEYDEGLVIVERGSRVTPVAIAALALEGRGSLRVYNLEARLLNVGDEIVSGTYFRPFTHLFVASWLEQHGVRVVEVSQVGDDEEAVREWVSRGGSYLTVLIGGTSMGGHDVTVRAVEGLNPEFMVHGFAVQPGKTACLAVIGGRPLVALSGLPVAAMSTLELVVRPLLRGLGLRLPEYPRVLARLTRRLTTKAGLLGFARVRVFERDGELLAEPVMVGGSGSLASLLRGNGFVVVPEEVEGFDEGEVVEVHLYGEVLAA